MITVHISFCRYNYVISTFKITVMYFFLLLSNVTLIKFKKKKKTCENMGKNIKSYATTQVHFPREREGGILLWESTLVVQTGFVSVVHYIGYETCEDLPMG